MKTSEATEDESYARLLVEATRQAAEKVGSESVAPRWDETGEHEGTYCLTCANELFPDNIDGGWIGEEDSPPHCEKCGLPLDFTFTDYGVKEQLKHFEEHGIRSEHDAFCVHAMMNANGVPLLTEWDYKPEWEGRIKSIYEALIEGRRKEQINEKTT